MLIERAILINQSLNHTNVFSHYSFSDPHLSNCKAVSNDWLDLCTSRACWIRGKTPWTGHQVTLTIPSHSLKPGALYSRSGLPNVHVFANWRTQKESMQTPCKWSRNLLAIRDCAIIITLTTTIKMLFKCWRGSEKWIQDLLESINSCRTAHMFENRALVNIPFLLTINVVQLQRNQLYYMSILMIVTVKFCLHIRVQRHYRKASRDGRGCNPKP